MTELLIESLPLMLIGALNAYAVTIVSMIIGVPLGLILALMRISEKRKLKTFALIYIEVWRAVPFIVEIFIVFFILPPLLNQWFQIDISTFETMVFGSTLWASANSAEVFRGAIQSIPFGQTEAAISLGMSYIQRLRLVIFPQALKITLPPMIGIFTLVLKGTAIGFIIDFRELIRMGQIAIERLYIHERTLASLEIYTIIMIIYFLMCYPLSQLSLYFERKLSTANGEKSK
jgi:polar amino acid transport system permease protein